MGHLTALATTPQIAAARVLEARRSLENEITEEGAPAR